MGRGRWGRGTLPELSLTASFASWPGLRGSPHSGASRSRILSSLKDQSGCTKTWRGPREPRERGERERGGGEGGTAVLAAGDTADTTAAGSTQPRKLRALPPHRVPPPHRPSGSDSRVDQSET